MSKKNYFVQDVKDIQQLKEALKGINKGVIVMSVNLGQLLKIKGIM